LFSSISCHCFCSSCQRHEQNGSASPQPDQAPEPIVTPWPDPLAEEAYYGLAGEIVRAIEPDSEADPVALLAQMLIAYGSVTGRSAHFIAEGDQHFTNEFAVLVGDTSKGRKGTSWGRVRRLFVGVDSTWAADRIQSGVSSGEGLIWAVRDPIITRQKVKTKGRVVGHQEVEQDPGVAVKRPRLQRNVPANLVICRVADGPKAATAGDRCGLPRPLVVTNGSRLQLCGYP
jgi:hypothetical protein